MTLKREPAADLPDSVAALVLVGKTAKEKKKNTGTRRGMRWAERLWRIYSVNVTACACGGQRKMVSLVDDAYAACKILKHIGLPADSPASESSYSPELQAA